MTKKECEEQGDYDDEQKGGEEVLNRCWKASNKFFLRTSHMSCHQLGGKNIKLISQWDPPYQTELHIELTPRRAKKSSSRWGSSWKKARSEEQEPLSCALDFSPKEG
ncbi:hypothetical protein CR513_48701, partial [Mucuna pruriens]